MRSFTALATAAFVAVALSGAAFAQSGGGVKIQQSSNPNEVQIQGNTKINADAQNVNTVAAGVANTAESSVGAIGGGTQIQGDTAINANAKDVNTVAVGVGNSSKAAVGTIGK